MKIQNAEMNFVLFDTEDVIVTSGPDSIGRAMAAQMKTIAQYNNQYKELPFLNVNGNQNGITNPDRGEQWLTYDIVGDLRRAEDSASKDEPTGEYFIADTVYKIKMWLDYHSNTKQ